MPTETLRGFLRYNPEMRFTATGKAITTFKVYKYLYADDTDNDKGQHVVTWEVLAEKCNENLARDNEVHMTGYYKTNSWTAQDGSPRSRREFTAQKIWLIDINEKQEEEFTNVMDIESEENYDGMTIMPDEG